MIDNFSILLSHALILLMFWRLLKRDDLDQEPPPVPDETPAGFGADIQIAVRRREPDDA